MQSIKNIYVNILRETSSNKEQQLEYHDSHPTAKRTHRELEKLLPSEWVQYGQRYGEKIGKTGRHVPVGRHIIAKIEKSALRKFANEYLLHPDGVLHDEFIKINKREPNEDDAEALIKKPEFAEFVATTWQDLYEK